MSFRAPLLRASLPRSAILSKPRALTTSSRPVVSALKPLPTAYSQLNNVRYLNTSQIAQLEASRAVGDGGIEEAPHSGINVHKPTSMDS
ncbi:uncharacterized protein I303_103588 [Kwoniella dejecticola CBS 10117]|uniref:Uncharacterized protein n=1 Tax=Kwoniella dejecticola CBS 10117 TaxID=1296121 RepID=A0A1A6A760_9TREE|nr:uncharacterized protein I303_03610 [Kwoniella dejecticola CBS 10117]OBR85895.1 hypothetical protein I303_03610 [Kwoniella dejecticola CBS 10117]